jgi:hypothetical protein
MSMQYVIQWKSKVNGRAGKGTKLFEHEEAARLADELNREYPNILHEAVPAPAQEQPPGAHAENEPAGAEAETEPAATATDSMHHLEPSFR